MIHFLEDIVGYINIYKNDIKYYLYTLLQDE